MEQLTPVQLQGIVAHEIAQLLRDDLRLNVRLISILNGMFLIHTVGRAISQFGNNFSNSIDIPLIKVLLFIARIPIFSLGMCAIAIGSIGHFWGRFIQRTICYPRG